MEENVALDSSKQKKFIKSVKGLQKSIKKKKTQVPKKSDTPDSPKVKDGKIKKKKRERGLVYLGHIPHGFYEHQMTQYFSQFGGVSNCRVIRSRRTGRSKGYAFVEFHDPAVAQIVAETMNNYLMGKRLIKANYIAPDKQRRAKRFSWNPQNNPSLNAKLQQKKRHNAVKTDAEELQTARNLMKSLNRTKKKMKELGINYDFFMPVDIPEDLIVIKQEKDDNTIKEEDEKPSKKSKTVEEDKPKMKNKKVATEIKVEEKKETVKTKKGAKKSVESVQSTQNRKELKKKEVKLEKAGVKHIENFIKVNNESDDDSDSLLEFDSDEFEKLLENDSDASIGSDEDGDSDNLDSDGSDDDDDSAEESVIDIPPKKQKSTVNSNKTKGNNQKAKQTSNVKTELPKRKLPVPQVTPGKKAKFEKQNNKKPMNKQFKKRK